MKRNLFDILHELSDYIETSDSPRETILMTLGFCIGVAIRVGWSFEELVALRLWPKPGCAENGTLPETAKQ